LGHYKLIKKKSI